MAEEGSTVRQTAGYPWYLVPVPCTVRLSPISPDIVLAATTVLRDGVPLRSAVRNGMKLYD